MSALVAMDLHQNLHAQQYCHSPDLSLKQTSNIMNVHDVVHNYVYF